MKKESDESKSFRLKIEGLKPGLKNYIMYGLYWSGIMKPVDQSSIRLWEGDDLERPYVKEALKMGIAGRWWWNAGQEVDINFKHLRQEAEIGSRLLKQRLFGKKCLMTLRILLGLPPITKKDRTTRKKCPCCGQKAPIGTIFLMPEKLP